MSSSGPPREGRFEKAIANIRDYAIFMLDARGHVETWNAGARAIKGYAPEEIIGRSFETFYTPEARAAGHPQKLLAVAREQGRVEEEGWRVRKDGTKFFADVVITALRDDSGELIGFAKVTRDLTDRRRADEQRFEAEQRFREIVDAVRDYAIFMLDTNGNVATWNTGAARIKGYRPEEIIGKHFSLFYPEESRATDHPWNELRIAREQGRFEEEGWRVRKDGSRFWANVVLTPLFNKEGKHVGFAKVTRDLTERREAELERMRLAQAQEAVRLRDDFLSIASHELRTPLMALQLQIESAMKLLRPDDAKLHSKLDRADRSVLRLAELVDALLDVTRIATGKLSMHFKHVDLGEVVVEVVERMQDAASKSGCKLASQVESGIIGNWDPLRMGQVVTNLISNAIKYAAKTPIDVELHRRDDHVVIRVTDGGPGVGREHLTRIFGRFERAVETKHYGGLGLGLYVASEIVVAHGGTIVASNRSGGGAIFEVTLPPTGASLGSVS